MTELTVIIKGAESSYKQKFLIYETFTWTESDPTIKQCVEESLSNTKIDPETIMVRATIQYQ